MIMEHFDYVPSQVLVSWDIVLSLVEYRFLFIYFFCFPIGDVIQEICGSISLDSFNYVLNVRVQVFCIQDELIGREDQILLLDDLFVNLLDVNLQERIYFMIRSL